MNFHIEFILNIRLNIRTIILIRQQGGSEVQLAFAWQDIFLMLTVEPSFHFSPLGHLIRVEAKYKNELGREPVTNSWLAAVKFDEGSPQATPLK